MGDNNIQVLLHTLRQKGNLAYEYNPFHNYQTNVDLYLVDNKFIVPDGCAVNKKNGDILIQKVTGTDWYDSRGRKIPISDVKTTNGANIYAKAGSVIDFETDKLNFDLDHPVDIEIQPSYDGSVNLILNDDKNIPRLINSRFSVREKNTYEIVDRIGENDTNIYSSDTFEKDTSLYYLYEVNPQISYKGFVKGVLPVGLYCFYFTYCDADENESDYIAETGLIPVFIGSDSDPRSIDGGIKNQLSNKGIRLKLTSLDNSYSYIKIYYVRYFADYLLNRVCECKKIYKKYPLNSSVLVLQITGNELAEDIDPNILNITRFNPKNLLAQALCKNMLFFGNIVKNIDNYKELSDCALRIIPSLVQKKIHLPDNRDYYSNEGSTGYYESSNMYGQVGYFNEEYYRFGVVFIYNNGLLSNVYNTLGGKLAENNLDNKKFSLFKTPGETDYLLEREYIPIDDNGWIKDSETYYKNGTYLNSKGVCLILYNGLNDDENNIIGIKFTIPDFVIKYLKEDLGIRGCFFVRQKCIPNILAQMYLLPMDETLEAPVIETKDKNYFTECLMSLEDLLITNTYSSRLYKYSDTIGPESAISRYAYAGLCPDFMLNQPYYNQIFNSSKFKIRKIENIPLTLDGRYYYDSSNYDSLKLSNGNTNNVIICSVTDDVPSVAIKDKVYKLEMGQAEESFRFKWAENDNGTYDYGNDNRKGENKDKDSVNGATNIVRGIYSPYLAVYSDFKLETSTLYNIYQENNLSVDLEYLVRMDSHDPFYAISDRYNFENLNKETSSKSLNCWRGDCYINTFTHRLNRNFNDPSLPNNDVIIDKRTWKDNYDAFDQTKWTNISRSDLNAVQMGSWITFKVRSAMNYALRSQDHSFVSEEALMGSPRSYYPRNEMMWKGANKMPDSYLYNDAYRASLGFKCYFMLSDINYIKDTFSNRILYSAISILDSFKNNYRYSLSTYFRDYSQEYGSILKLVGFEGYLLVIFEHAIGIAVVNERVLAGNGDGEPVFINTKNVLPDELTIITDTYGTQWPESVIKSEAGYVYGVDTAAKKIWRVKGLLIEILSDFKVGKFLIDNITLGERELYPTVGLRNVKTHYNNNKKDIMFTFYDDIYDDEEKVWNLCFNELLEEFVTFYSWVPSYSANIDTQYFSFNRQTSKKLALLGKHNYSIPENQGVLVDNPILDDSENVLSFDLYYSSKNKDIVIPYTIINSDGTTLLKEITRSGFNTNNGLYKLENCKFRIEHDHWGNYNNVTISDNKVTLNISGNVYGPDKDGTLYVYQDNNGDLKRVDLENMHFYVKNDTLSGEKYIASEELPAEGIEFEKCSIINNAQDIFKALGGIMLLKVTPYLDAINEIISETFVQTLFKTETIALTLDSLINKTDEQARTYLTTDFYLHGLAGIFNVVENLYPTYWYGKTHPFEFEFVVNDKIAQLKIFNDLILISNKAEPESFHFEIEGDNYEFSADKRTMYFRQEATKNLYLNLGSDIIYDRKFTDVRANMYTLELYYRGGEKYNYETNNRFNWDRAYPVNNTGLVKQVKSTIFPLYYRRIDTYDEIYHNYSKLNGGDNYDFKNLSGSEIKWDRDSNQFNIITHIKNSPIDYYGRIRGNSRYKEGKWHILIPSITFSLKNESEWVNIPKSNTITEYNSPLREGDKIPPIIINLDELPNDLTSNTIVKDTLPNIYKDDEYTWRESIDTNKWTFRKETKIRDKWVKIRVRYSGKNLAIIHSLITLYNISYA